MFLHQRGFPSHRSIETLFSLLYPQALRAPSQITLNITTQLDVFHIVTDSEFLFSLLYSTNINKLLHVPGTVLDTGNVVVMRHEFPAFMGLLFEWSGKRQAISNEVITEILSASVLM